MKYYILMNIFHFIEVLVNLYYKTFIKINANYYAV
jgi:hypothetical protein